MDDEEIQAAIDGAKTLGDTANAAADTMSSKIMPLLKNMYDGLNDIFGSTSQDTAKKYASSFDDLSDVLTSLKYKMKDLSDSTSVLSKDGETKLGTLSDPIDKLLGAFVKVQSFVSNAKFFDQFADSSSSSINLIGANLNDVQKIMSDFKIPGADAITRLGSNFLSNAEQAEKFENSFIGLSAAAGNMNDIFNRETGELKNVGALTAEYAKQTEYAADATGLSVKQSMDFANSLKAIPGALNEQISTSNKTTESTSSLIEVMKLMTGTGRSQKEVIDSMGTAYNNLSTATGTITDSTQKFAEYFATISTTANTLGVDFNTVKGIMDKTADSFRFVGNETDATARILGRYTDALRETGLTSKSSVDIINGMVEGVSKLNMGTKAFLSLRSGGPGGLQGAFQIEQLLRQGKLDQVVQMAESSLKQQFGGRIYTQAEAATSPQAASQFMRQRQLLQSGAFGIGKDMGNDQATRLLEALGKGNLGAATAEIKTGKDAVEQVSKRGEQIQERNNNELKVANRALDSIRISAELSAGLELKRAFGAEGGRAGDLRNRTSTAEDLSRQEIDRSRSMKNGLPDMQDFVKDTILSARNATKNLISSGTEVGKGAVDVFGAGVGGISSTSRAIKDLTMELQNQGEFTEKPPQIEMPKPEQHNQYHNEVLRNATKNTISHTNAARTIANSNKTTQTSNNKDQKVVLEIIAPKGYETVVKEKTDDTIVRHNNQSTNPRIGN